MVTSMTLDAISSIVNFPTRLISVFLASLEDLSNLLSNGAFAFSMSSTDHGPSGPHEPGR